MSMPQQGEYSTSMVPSPLQQRQGHLIQNSLSYVLPIADEGYSSLFITVSGLN